MNLMDPQMTAMYYPVPLMLPVGQFQPYPFAYSNFFMFPTTAATPYSEGLISPPVSYSIPDSNQLSTPASAPAQVPNDEMVRAFENHTVSSFSASPQVRNDIQQSVTGSNNTVDNDTVSEYQYSQIMEPNPMDPQMTTMHYPISPVGQVQPHPVASPNFFMPLPTTTATPYSEGLISPPISYSIPDSNQPSTPDSALSQVSNDEMTKAFENHTVSSFSASPQVRNDIQQSITDSNNTIDNDNVGEYLAIYGQITELKVFTVCSCYNRLYKNVNQDTRSCVMAKKDMRHTIVLFIGTTKLPFSTPRISTTAGPICTNFIYFMPFIYIHNFTHQI